MALWKDTKLHLYEQYKGGAITRESYGTQIQRGKARMEELEQTRNFSVKSISISSK